MRMQVPQIIPGQWCDCFVPKAVTVTCVIDMLSTRTPLGQCGLLRHTKSFAEIQPDKQGLDCELRAVSIEQIMIVASSQALSQSSMSFCQL